MYVYLAIGTVHRDNLECYDAYNMYRLSQCAATIHGVERQSERKMSSFNHQQRDVTASLMEIEERKTGRHEREEPKEEEEEEEKRGANKNKTKREVSWARKGKR